MQVYHTALSLKHSSSDISAKMLTIWNKGINGHSRVHTPNANPQYSSTSKLRIKTTCHGIDTSFTSWKTFSARPQILDLATLTSIIVGDFEVRLSSARSWRSAILYEPYATWLRSNKYSSYVPSSTLHAAVTNMSMHGCERCERAGNCLVGLSVPWRPGIMKPYIYSVVVFTP